MLSRVRQHSFQAEAMHVASALPCGNNHDQASPRGFGITLAGRCAR
jgi:hypothetical protein